MTLRSVCMIVTNALLSYTRARASREKSSVHCQDKSQGRHFQWKEPKSLVGKEKETSGISSLSRLFINNCACTPRTFSTLSPCIGTHHIGLQESSQSESTFSGKRGSRWWSRYTSKAERLLASISSHRLFSTPSGATQDSLRTQPREGASLEQPRGVG